MDGNGTLMGYGIVHNPAWLLDELLNVLATHSKGPGDVRWVGSKDGTATLSWAEFAPIAAQFDTHRGYPEDLVIVGDDWWLEQLYDDSYWEFRTLPVRQPNAMPFDEIEPYLSIGFTDDEEADN